MEPDHISVKGAREHNLRNISLKLPRNRLICFTGVSGSGKSSLAFDTLHAEGQRRYIESLSSYARQFLGQLAKPDVDLITGLSPTISIQQKTGGWNPRSTVATVTQIHDFLRVLFARAGIQHCPLCARKISAQSREQIIAQVMTLPQDSTLTLLAPVVRRQKGEFRDLFDDMLNRGFSRARVDGRLARLDDPPRLDRNKRHNIEVLVDRIRLTPAARPRLAQSIENALELGDGTLIVQMGDSETPQSRARRSVREDLLFSSHYACTHCRTSYEPPTPQMFSFNAPAGMCPSCDGLGTTFDFDAELIVPDSSKSFLDVAIEPMRSRIGRWRRHIYEAVARNVGFNLRTPWKKLSSNARDALLYGTGDRHLTFEWKWSGGVWRHGGTFEGVIKELRDKYRNSRAPFMRAFYEKYMRTRQCSDCDGAKLKPQSLAVRLNDKNIHDFLSMNVVQALRFLDSLQLTPLQQRIAEEIIKELHQRLQFLVDVGLHYLELDRGAPTLSGGESQRIRLASQIGSSLVGVLYVLDEPSIGLHPRDNRMLLQSLKRLRDLGNTVIVVEHDEETMRSADLVVDFGPGPGIKGGHLVALGTINDITRSKRSVTGQYLSGQCSIDIPRQRRPVGPVPGKPVKKSRSSELAR